MSLIFQYISLWSSFLLVLKIELGTIWSGPRFYRVWSRCPPILKHPFESVPWRAYPKLWRHSRRVTRPERKLASSFSHTSTWTSFSNDLSSTTSESRLWDNSDFWLRQSDTMILWRSNFVTKFFCPNCQNWISNIVHFILKRGELTCLFSFFAFVKESLYTCFEPIQF